MSAEFRVREEIVHSLVVISDELDEIENVLSDQNISSHLRKVFFRKNVIRKAFKNGILLAK